MTTPRARVEFTLPSAPASISIRGSAFHHMRNVLRVNCNDPVEVLDPRGNRGLCRVESLDEEEAVLRLETVVPVPEQRFDLTMVTSPLKRKNTSLLLAKWGEMGVARIILVPMRRSVVSVRDEKLSHLTEVVHEACRAVGQQLIPRVELAASLAAVIQSLKGTRLVHLDEDSGWSVKDLALSPGSKAACVLGPEGGFDPEELRLLQEAGSAGFRMNGPAYRSETAGLLGAALLLHEAGEL